MKEAPTRRDGQPRLVGAFFLRFYQRQRTSWHAADAVMGQNSTLTHPEAPGMDKKQGFGRKLCALTQ